MIYKIVSNKTLGGGDWFDLRKALRAELLDYNTRRNTVVSMTLEVKKALEISTISEIEKKYNVTFEGIQNER